MMKWMLLAGLALLLAVKGVFAAAAEVVEPLPVAIAADAPQIRYTGRFVDRAGGKAFDWVGSTIEVKFSGTAIAALLVNDRAVKPVKEGGFDTVYYNVSIDGGAPTVLPMADGQQRYLLATGLAPGEHRVTLFRRNESFYGLIIFKGLEVSAGGAVLEMPARTERRIEVIGDSISVGYGNEGKDMNDPFRAETENNALTYGALAAQHLNAEYVCIAWSGKGVLRNRGTEESRYKATMRDLYKQTLGMDGKAVWTGAGQPTADVVVINLGTNDYSGATPVTQEAWVTAYRELVDQAFTYHPAAQVVCTVGPLMSGAQSESCRAFTQAMIDALPEAKRAQVHLLTFAPMDIKANGIGTHYHPSVATHRIMAETLAAYLSTLMKWEHGPAVQ